MYDGATIVSRSIALGQPIIYVSMNYRLSGFGFMAGREVKDAKVGNLGLQDRKFITHLPERRSDLPVFIERESFRWIQKYIGAFGGDPDKVTMYGSTLSVFL